MPSKLRVEKDTHTRRKVHQVIEFLKKRIVHHANDEVVALGGYIRNKPRIRDIDILTSVPLKDVMKRIGLARSDLVSGGQRKIRFIFHDIPVDIYYATKKEWPYSTLFLTGDKLFNIILRTHAKQHGFLLSQYGLYDAKTHKPVRGSSKIKTEKDIFDAIKFPWRKPFERSYSE